MTRGAAWVVELLDDGDGRLITDATGDLKSSTGAVGGMVSRQVV
ncbi:hypothetical protein [Streptomyces sp. NBC_01614]